MIKFIADLYYENNRKFNKKYYNLVDYEHYRLLLKMDRIMSSHFQLNQNIRQIKKRTHSKSTNILGIDLNGY